MPQPHAFATFLAAAVVLAATPGPGMLYVLARSLRGGRGEGIASSLGTWVGGMVHVLAAAIGISALLATSAVAFSVVKYAGAAYLVYLGVRTLLSREPHQPKVKVLGSNWAAFRQGIVTEVLNPKTALFFLAFIPQFVDRAAGGVFWQFVLLGSISVALNTLADVIVALLAGPLGARMNHSPRFRRGSRVTAGCTMIALGAYAAVSEQK
ncbi:MULTISPECIES: LysE family translocator [unclassified Meiothermus]|uniref:LysE family translocator n=1 Tax=unclassified Meiothermus TaxID=370471 RepID=UPI000D7C05DC|nr:MULTISPECIES: LysE family translocator [unclassified Meiothermus]PZA08179.1 LysE family translocator [Meiothermus sp. Pnk-1]RYM32668.1 LysE family translocator [Meiothermus sp. PNK-Is4]